MKEQDKFTAGDLSEIEISTMPDRKFKVMIIKLPTGLQKRMEDSSEAFDKDIKNTLSEMKISINKIENTIG